MKKLAALMISFACIGSVQAENLFQNNNPFPQTVPQTMNNIYESKPFTIQNEEKQAKKSLFKKGKNLQEESVKMPNQRQVPVYPVQYDGVKVNEGNTNGFYMFTTGQ